MTLILLILLTVISCVLTFFFRRYALIKSIIDIPNHRSSHSVPTPRGGGLAIVISFLFALAFLNLIGYINSNLTWAYAIAGTIVACLGFMDDRHHIDAKWRLLAHILASMLMLFWLNGIPPLIVFGQEIQLTITLNILGIFYIVWLLNLYNFMDGIDGLASIQAITVCVGGGFLYLQMGNSEGALLPFVLGAAILGFLIWNFPPAKIFMGDAGSGFIGLLIAGFSIHAAWAAPGLFWSWIILSGVFITDATVTLIRRVLCGAQVFEAHRSHAYQHAAIKYGSHKVVTITVMLINIFWLFPWAIAVANSWIDGFAAAIISFLPILWLSIKFKSGIEE
jgi:Fuc2NAc and GlcNAc transferase